MTGRGCGCLGTHGRFYVDFKEIKMGLPRTFVSFSSTDIHYFRLMQAWKANTKIDFNFTDCQLDKAINSENEYYIKRLLHERLNMAGTFILLIGDDTKDSDFVKWEIEIAKEKKCRLIGVNIDKNRDINYLTCPLEFMDSGAMFVPFSPFIVAYALKNFEKKSSGNWHYNKEVYKDLGYPDES